jgi:hypothetical protein
MTGESANRQKMLLAAALAEGTGVAKFFRTLQRPDLSTKVQIFCELWNF